MKLPSISQIWADYIGTVQRFPLTMISAVLGTITAIVLVENEPLTEPTIAYKILLTTVLAFPFLTALKLATEREGANPGRIWLFQAIGVVLLVLYGVTVPADLPRAPLYHLFRFFAFGIGCCLLLSFLPFLSRGLSNGFWQFNRIVVFRIILAGAFAFVLLSGLGLALAALDNLFGMNIPPERYFELWILILGLFVVPFLLSGLPENLAKLDEVSEYPRSLKVFGQYVLPPLVLVYFVILYAYVSKIIFTWTWPQGWVGRLILGFSATGILSLFILDPIRERLETSWIKKAALWYYIILLPMIAVLFLALWRRISEYGLTEDRYIGLSIGVWLAFIAGYFLLTRAKSIKMIPTSLCVLTFLISVGPWGMFSVSEQSQISRLKGILEADSILVSDRIQRAPSEVPMEHEVEISSILSYLQQIHGYDEIQPWFAESLALDTAQGGSRFRNPSDVAEMMGIEYRLFVSPTSAKYFFVAVDTQTPISISGYEYALQATYGNSPLDADIASRPLKNEIKTTADSVVLSFVTDSTPAESIVIPIRPLIEQVASAYTSTHSATIPVEQAMIEYNTDDFRSKVVLLDAHLRHAKDSAVVPNSYNLLILYSRGTAE